MLPSWSGAFTSAPWSMQPSTLSGGAALMKSASGKSHSGRSPGTSPRLSGISGSAPSSSSLSTTGVFPVFQAACSGVSPFPLRAFMSAPAPTSAETITVSRRSEVSRQSGRRGRETAMCSGVSPSSLAASGSAPASRSRTMFSCLSRRTAPCSGVLPRRSATATSAPASSRAATTADAPYSAATPSGDGS